MAFLLARRRDLLLALAIAGVAVAGYLSWVALDEEQEAICSGVGDCGRVQSSEFSEIAGVPIAVLGLGMYLALLALIAARRWWGALRDERGAAGAGGPDVRARARGDALLRLPDLARAVRDRGDLCLVRRLGADRDAADAALPARCARRVEGCRRGRWPLVGRRPYHSAGPARGWPREAMVSEVEVGFDDLTVLSEGEADVFVLNLNGGRRSAPLLCHRQRPPLLLHRRDVPDLRPQRHARVLGARAGGRGHACAARRARGPLPALRPRPCGGTRRGGERGRSRLVGPQPHWRPGRT